MENKDKSLFIFEGNQFVSEEEQTLPIDEVLRMRKEELETINLNFKYLWETYKTVSMTCRLETEQYRIAKIRTCVSYCVARLLRFLYRSDACEELEKLGCSISSTLREFKDERKLLKEIGQSIKQLKKYNVIDCNDDISKLLSLMDEKYVLLDGVLRDGTRSLEVRLRGIDYSSNAGLRTKLSVVNEDIDSKVQSLNLHQQNKNPII